MQHCDDGEYREIANHAVSDLLEPGSVFKTASIMAALDDGYVDTTYMVETGGGVWNMYGRDMKDHNWSRGGYGTLMLPWTLKYSSNIGVSRIIDKFYHDQPEKFVQKIHSFGLATDYKVPIPGYVPGVIRMPKKNKRGQYTNWSKTALDEHRLRDADSAAADGHVLQRHCQRRQTGAPAPGQGDHARWRSGTGVPGAGGQGADRQASDHRVDTAHPARGGQRGTGKKGWQRQV